MLLNVVFLTYVVLLVNACNALELYYGSANPSVGFDYGGGGGGGGNGSRIINCPCACHEGLTVEERYSCAHS